MALILRHVHVEHFVALALILLIFRFRSKARVIRFLSTSAMWLRWFRLKIAGTTVGEALGGLGVPENVRKAYGAMDQVRPAGSFGSFKTADFEKWIDLYQPDAVVDSMREGVLNPVFALHEAVKNPDKLSEGNPFKGVKPTIEEAWLYEECVDERGARPKTDRARESMVDAGKSGHKIEHVVGHENVVEALKRSEAAFQAQPSRAREAIQKEAAILKALREDGFGDFNGIGGQYDINQYTEYVPLTGGPFNRQLYIYDFLKQIAYAFEASNHNPLAKAILSIPTLYAFGRRFEVRIQDDQKKRVWEKFDKDHKIVTNVSRFWARELEMYGDWFLHKKTWQAVDPSTIWDIITEPENIENEFYAYQAYPTQYQIYTGFNVPGAPGGEKQPGSKYIIKQIPMKDLIHVKINCASNEKRGRSSLFPILGWLKRLKDLYNAQVIREWLYSSFIWDVTVKGSATDVSSFASTFSSMPNPGSPFFHNESVELKPQAGLPTAGKSGGSGMVAELTAFIISSQLIPKEFVNVISQGGGGSRVQALTAAEPFTKRIEDIQSIWEEILTTIFQTAMEQSGLEYEDGDVEFLFPSVTKDTTTETLGNLALCETQGWFSKRMAGEMAAKEMNVTSYDFEEEQKTIKQDESDGFNLNGGPPVPPGRLGFPGETDDTASPVHGQGKTDLIDGMKNI